MTNSTFAVNSQAQYEYAGTSLCRHQKKVNKDWTTSSCTQLDQHLELTLDAAYLADAGQME